MYRLSKILGISILYQNYKIGMKILKLDSQDGGVLFMYKGQ